MRRCIHQNADGQVVAAQCPQCLLEVGLTLEGDETAIRGAEGDADERSSLTPGVTIADRFCITALVGRGGMGEIYRADDLKLGQSVALKFISHQRPSEDAIRSFYDEVRLGRLVAHPSVCRIYDLLEFGGRPFIVMQFVDGEDLASLLARSGRVPYRKALDIARDVCWGLDAAHEQGIVHGDLKPSNIMIDGRGRARITDFGLSRLAAEESRRGNRFAGTVAYMAPEQFSDLSVSSATDIYSLGLVLYELFTGRRAHEISRQEDVQRMFDSLPDRPSIDQPRIAPEVERTITRCLSVDPRGRPDSVRAVLVALGGGDAVDAMILAGETPTPEYVAAIRKLQPLRRQQALGILGASLLCLTLVLALSSRLTLYARTDLVRSPDVLAASARDLAIRLGSAAPIADDGSWFEANLSYLRRHTSDLPRSGMIRNDLFPPIVFHYRSSRSPLAPLGADGRLHSDDPPTADPGMVHVELAPNGRLIRMQSFAPREGGKAHQSFRWASILADAGINPRTAVPASVTWSPAVPHDEARAWQFNGVLIRAARNGDHLSDFEIVDPFGRTPVAAREWTVPDAVYYAVIAAALIAGGFLARRNVRMKRVDRRGALRLGMWVLFCRLMFGLLASHHPLVLEKEPAHLAALAGAALLLSAEVTLAYVAFEPLVRQRWPNLMIGWMRFGQGRVYDPIVGREILVGTLAGLLFRLFDHVRNVAPRLIPSLRVVPSHLAVELLGSMREVAGALFYYQARAIFYALFAMFLLLLLSMLFRFESISAIVWLVATTAIWSRWDDPRIDVPIVIVQMSILLLTLKRFGLLSLVTAVYTDLLAAQFPLTVDFTRFYFPTSVAVSMLIAGLILLGFRASLASRRPASPPISALL